MKISIVILLLAVFLLVHLPLAGGKLYRWVDKEGNLHFTDSPASVPSEYRDQVDIDEFGEPEKPSYGNIPAQEILQRKRVIPPHMEEETRPARHEIPYIAFEGNAKRIIIAVTLNGNVSANMALDTGAPGMVITHHLAERLGLVEAGKGMVMITAGGIGGTAPAVRTIIDAIQIGDIRDTFIPTTVVPLDTAAFEGLIGMDFMSRYSMNIEPDRQVVIFSEMTPGINSPGGHDEGWWRTRFREFSSIRNEWKEYMEKLEKIIRESPDSGSPEMENVKKARAFAELQHREADKLFFKLNSYAIDHAVPMNWREY